MCSLRRLGNHFFYDHVTGLLQDGYVKSMRHLSVWKNVDPEAANASDKSHYTFVGVEYECPLGHRAFVDVPEREQTRIKDVVAWPEKDLAIFIQCPDCQKAPVFAQLMRILIAIPASGVASDFQIHPVVKVSILQ